MIEIIATAASGFLVFLFLFTGSIKTFRWQAQVAEFQLGFMRKYGLNCRVYSAIGVLEMFGALGLLLQGVHVLGALAAAGLFLLSLGAFSYHIRFDSFSFGVPSLLTAILSLFILVANATLIQGLPANLIELPERPGTELDMAGCLLFVVGMVPAFFFSRAMIGMAAAQNQ